jgi:hypothetical protein
MDQWTIRKDFKSFKLVAREREREVRGQGFGNEKKEASGLKCDLGCSCPKGQH